MDGFKPPSLLQLSGQDNTQEVDWAAMAQQWMQTKQSQPETAGFSGSSGSFPPGHNYNFPPPTFFSPPPPTNPAFHVAQKAPDAMQGPPRPQFFASPAYRPRFFSPPRPPPQRPPFPADPYPPPVGLKPGPIPQPAEPAGPLFQSHKVPPIEETTQSYESQTHENEYLQLQNSDPSPDMVIDGAMAHWMMDMNNDPNQTAKKRLPQWILEGLEQAEREKQKQLEKEKMEQQRAELEKQREQRRIAKGLGKFDTDSEDEEDEDGKPLSAQPIFAPDSAIGSRKALDQDEVRQNESAALKRLVVKVLLQATDLAIEDQVTRAFRSHKPTKPIVDPNKLKVLQALAAYSDDEEEDERNEDEHRQEEQQDGRRAASRLEPDDEFGDKERRRSSAVVAEDRDENGNAEKRAHKRRRSRSRSRSRDSRRYRERRDSHHDSSRRSPDRSSRHKDPKRERREGERRREHDERRESRDHSESKERRKEHGERRESRHHSHRR